MNTRSFPSGDVNSDHQLVMANLRLRFANRRHNKRSTKEFKRHDVEKLHDPQIPATKSRGSAETVVRIRVVYSR